MSQSRFHTISWSPPPSLPVTRTTPATFCGQVVIIGGYQNPSPVNSIYQLIDGQWIEIGSMGIGRCWCFLANPSREKMMIVGGWKGHLRTQVNVCEECVAVQQVGHIIICNLIYGSIMSVLYLYIL